MATYPMKYLKMDDGFIALVWSLDGQLSVSEEVFIGIGPNGIEARVGEVVLPILDSMLPDLLQRPRIQVSFMTEEPIDDQHILVELELPKLYEMKGALSMMRTNNKAGTAKTEPALVEPS